MDPTQMSPQQQAMIMALMSGAGQMPGGMPQAAAGGLPPGGVASPAGVMGGGMPAQQAPGGQVSPYASMLGVMPPQGY